MTADNGTRHMTSFYNETLLSHSSQTCEMQSNQSKPVHGRFTHLCCRGDDSNAGLHGEASQAVQNPIKWEFVLKLFTIPIRKILFCSCCSQFYQVRVCCVSVCVRRVKLYTNPPSEDLLYYCGENQTGSCTTSLGQNCIHTPSTYTTSSGQNWIHTPSTYTTSSGQNCIHTPSTYTTSLGQNCVNTLSSADTPCGEHHINGVYMSIRFWPTLNIMGVAQQNVAAHKCSLITLCVIHHLKYPPPSSIYHLKYPPWSIYHHQVPITIKYSPPSRNHHHQVPTTINYSPKYPPP